MRKRVILYNPKSVFYDMPLALLAIGSVLDTSKYEVVIVDARIDKDAHGKVLGLLDGAIAFGVTALTGAPLNDALAITKKVHEANSSIPIIWGGWHPSLFPEQTLKDVPEIDISVQGQGELTFVEIIDHIYIGIGFEAIKGICYRSQNGIKRNPPRPMADMNELPPVNYDLIDVEAYYRMKKRRQFDYISSTGCFYRCAFCADPFVYERGWTCIGAERMVNELAHWHSKYPYDDINFQDETFFTKRKRNVEIAERLIDANLNISWAGTMRADQAKALRDEEWELCVKSGMRRVLVGVESGSQQMMDWLKKDIKMEQIYHAAAQAKKYGVAVIFPFIVGFPNETDESVNDSLRVAKELNSMSEKFTTPIFYFKPYPGSQITADVSKTGYQLPQSIEEWADFDYIGSSGPWVSDEKYEMVERFKFYTKLAYGRKRLWALPVQQLARLRCSTGYYGLPLEKKLAETLMPQAELS